MDNKIVLNFKNIVSELESKELKICFIKDNNGLFIEDKQGNLYMIESYWHGSYLDNIVKNEAIVEFNLVDSTLSKNIENSKKELWDVSEVKSFIKRQFLYKMQEVNIIIDYIDVKVEDVIYLSTDCKYDEDFKQWSAEYYEDYIVTKVDRENGMVWIKDCPYSIDMATIINVERKLK